MGLVCVCVLMPARRVLLGSTDYGRGVLSCICENQNALDSGVSKCISLSSVSLFSCVPMCDGTLRMLV